jgi:hypothetical protein
MNRRARGSPAPRCLKRSVTKPSNPATVSPNASATTNVKYWCPVARRRASRRSGSGAAAK